MVHQVFGGSGDLDVLHLQRTAAYDATACGPVASVDVAFAVQRQSPIHASYLIALRQSGAVYTLPGMWVDDPNWTVVNKTGLHAADFMLLTGAAPPHPDFSSGRLEFGYVTANSCGSNGAPACATEETTSALGGWFVVVHR